MFKVGDKVQLLKGGRLVLEYEDEEILEVYTIRTIVKKAIFGIYLVESDRHNFSRKEVEKLIPNNTLSRLIYPNYTLTKCKKYLKKSCNLEKL